MKRMVIIGIDGMDRDVLSLFESSLPNLSALKQSTPVSLFRSIFPPDTTPAWATIYTGESPAEHGIINFLNPADKTGGYEPLQVSDCSLKGKTFWDALSEAGISVCLVLPILVYPGWPIKGNLLIRSMIPRNLQEPLKSFPEDIIDRYKPSPEKLNMVGGFYSASQKKGLLELLRTRLKEEHRLSAEMHAQEKWSLFFAYFSSLDEVQHIFWPYWDKKHPYYPGPNEFETVIGEFYREMDRIVGAFSDACRSDDALIVLSDHGHGPRPSLIVNLNEWLRREGYLYTKKKSYAKAKNKMKSQIKKGLLDYVHKYGAGQFLMALSKRFPVWKQLLVPSSEIDWSRTVSYVSDLSAVKNYSYGGIRLNLAGNETEKNRIIEEILSSIHDLTIPGTETPIVRYAVRREALYDGPFIDSYPEILLELDERYGIGWGFTGVLFEDEGNMFHLKPGTHRRSTAVFLSNNLDKELLKDEMDLLDIAPLIKRYFGLRPNRLR